jgi:hypothetical protein
LLLRFSRCDRLVNEKVLLTPEIKLYDNYQSQAAKQIRPQYVTGPVFAKINARDTDQDYQDAKEH